MTVTCASLKVFNQNRNYSCKKGKSFTPFSPSFQVPERATFHSLLMTLFCVDTNVYVYKWYIFLSINNHVYNMIRTVMFIFILKMVTYENDDISLSVQ